MAERNPKIAAYRVKLPGGPAFQRQRVPYDQLTAYPPGAKAFGRCLCCRSEGQKPGSPVIKGIAITRAPDFLNVPKVGRRKADPSNPYNGRDEYSPKLVSETPIHNLLTVKETAEYLRIPLPTVYYLVQRGKIPAIHIGGRWRIKKSSLDRDILRQDKQGQPTVLVVDDDPGLQDLFRTFLKKIGFSRVVVGTATEAIKNLRK